MERPAIEGDSPVIENNWSCFLDTQVTLVESEIEPETVRLQAVGALIY